MNRLLIRKKQLALLSSIFIIKKPILRRIPIPFTLLKQNSKSIGEAKEMYNWYQAFDPIRDQLIEEAKITLILSKIWRLYANDMISLSMLLALLRYFWGLKNFVTRDERSQLQSVCLALIVWFAILWFPMIPDVKLLARFLVNWFVIILNRKHVISRSTVRALRRRFFHTIRYGLKTYGLKRKLKEEEIISLLLTLPY
jgi:hypothetical protein